MNSEKELVQKPSPYAGRWVARLQGKIIAHGGTPEQARLAAQKTRYKETPEILYMPTVSEFSFSPLIARVQAALPRQKIYLVGGILRDALLGRISHDYDFAVAKNAIDAARRVAAELKADFYVLDEGFDTARVIMSNQDGERDILDFAAFRGADLDADLRSRDFTINALAFDLQTEAILDPLNGASDLRFKIIRACSGTAMRDDPIRILRAIRQAAAFGFKIEPGTRKAMKQAASFLPKVSPERQRDELFKILDGSHPDAALRALEILGVFQYFLPELSDLKGVEQSPPHVKDVWEHTLSVIISLDEILTVLSPGYSTIKANDIFTGSLTLRLGRYREQLAAHFHKSLNADRSLRALLFFSVLYHDISKPATKSIDATGRIRFLEHDMKGALITAERARAFNLSNDEIERLKTIIANHMRFHLFTSIMEGEKKGPSRKAIYRFYRDAGEAGVDLILLGLADLKGTRGPNLTQETWTAAIDVARIFLENFWEKPEEAVAPLRLVDGHDIIKEYNIPEGPVVGKLLEAIREAQATGKVITREEAISFGREWLKENQNESGLF
jgi:tRNA nucleotidyltransferase/poly(A) polymerase